MKKKSRKKLFSAFATLCTALSLFFAFSGCASSAPFKKDGDSSDLEATSDYVVKEISYVFDDTWDTLYQIGIGERVITFTNYESYISYPFGLDYTKDYFERNDLVVFVATACSSDKMVFYGLKKEDSVIHPVFLRNRIPDGAAVTEDIILLSYRVELPKDEGVQCGDILYRYR